MGHLHDNETKVAHISFARCFSEKEKGERRDELLARGQVRVASNPSDNKKGNVRRIHRRQGILLLYARKRGFWED